MRENFYEKRKREKMKLNTILIGGFLVIALLVGFSTFVSISVSKNALQESIGENSVLLAEETMDKIDRSIYSRIEEFQTYSKDPTLREELINSNQEFENLTNIQDYIDKKDKEWITTSEETITPFMQELIENRLSVELNEKIGFYEKEYGYKVFGEVFITNKYGANVAQTGKTSDYYQADEDWWQSARKDDLYVGDVEYDESAGVYSTEICVRVDDKNGNFIGVIKAVLDIKEIINIIDEMGAASGYETMNIELISKEEGLIYGTGEQKIFADAFQILLEFKEREEQTGHFIIKEPDEEEQLVAHAYSRGYRNYKGLDWVLVIEHKTGEIFSPINGLRNLLLMVSMVVIVLAILIGFLISRLISRPLKKLSQTVDEVSKGNFKVEVNKDSKVKEVNTLADSLDRIMKTMKLAVLRGGMKTVRKEKKLIDEKKLLNMGLVEAKENPSSNINKQEVNFKKVNKKR